MSSIPSSTPRVSVIVPVYNRCGFLNRCLASVLATNYPDLELLVVDDGSSDGSWELIQQRAAAHENTIQALHHPGHQNRGISASRNLGIQRATGKYVAFLDSDDEYFPHRFDQCVGLLEAQPNLHAVYEAVLIESDHGGEASLVPSAETRRCIEKDPLGWLFRNDWWHTSGITVRRDCLIRLGMFREDLAVCEDTELWMRLAATGSIGTSQQSGPVATVHRHDRGHSWDRIGTSKRARIYRRSLRLARNAIERRPNLFDPRAKDAFKARHFRALEDEIDRLSSAAGSLPSLLRLGVEAALAQPGALLTKRSIGNLLNLRKWQR